MVRKGFTRLHSTELPVRSRLGRGGRRGFTLIELLLVVSVIGILAGVVIAAINPTRQLAQARNAMRRSDVNTLANAISQYTIDHSGQYPASVLSTLQQIGTATGSCAVPCGGTGTGTIVTLYPSADATVQENTATTNYGSAIDLQDYPWEPNWTRRFLVHFDLSSIPTGSTISSALLSLRESTTYGATRTVGAYRATRSWTEGGVTWNKADASTNWSAPGGDAALSPTATASLSWDGVLGWNNWNVTSDVQSFVSGLEQNFGWLFRDTAEDNSQAYWFFHSKEEAQSGDLRPYLQVTYIPVNTQTVASCVNLTPDVTPAYISSIPDDPLTGTSARTQYAVQIDTLGRLLVRACAAELGETIEVRR